ncbi:zinc ribbon domain-containing protein [Neisseriaceae bacterium JH1-16]|nr:zinc ribbon domain-containing protein [Neisseriaceae bacterium JH1-16]
MYCISCGKKLCETARFCSSCGMKLAKNEKSMPWHDHEHEHESAHHPAHEAPVDSEMAERGRAIPADSVSATPAREEVKPSHSEAVSTPNVNYPPQGLPVNTVRTDQMPTDFTALALKQAKLARRCEVASDSWVPQWVRVFIDSGGKPEELIQILIERVLQNPHETTLQEAQIVLSELGRGDEGAAQLHQQITRELLKELARLGCEADR